MNSKQQLITFIGILLIGLTIWFEWRNELNTVLFNAPPANVKPGAGTVQGNINDLLNDPQFMAQLRHDHPEAFTHP